MPKKSIYMKYREERDYAKYLKESKTSSRKVEKVAAVRLERLDLNALKKKKPSVPVSLPIKYFNNVRSTMSTNHDGQKLLHNEKYKIGGSVCQDVRPIATATNLRQVRHQVVAAKHDTTIIKSKPIKPNLILVNLSLSATRDAEKKSKKIETYTPTNAINTAANAHAIPFQTNDYDSMKRKPTKQNYGIAQCDVSTVNSKEVETNIPTNIIDTAAKANIMPFQENCLNMNYYLQKIDTAEKVNEMPYEAAPNKITLTNSKDIETNTSADIIDTGEISNDHISIKHKLPVPVVPTKEKFGIAHTQVNDGNSNQAETSTPTDIINTATKANEKIASVSSANEVKICLKALVFSSTQTDKIPITNEKELHILEIVTKSGVTNDELVDALESFKKVKELSKFNVAKVIDVEESADEDGAMLLELASYHSFKNKKALYENCVRASNPTSTEPAPTPNDLEQQKILEERSKLNNSSICDTIPLKNIINSQDNTNNKENKIHENSNKKRKTTESSNILYLNDNMEMEIDVPKTQTIMNQPVTATPLPKPSLQKSTTQPPQMQPVKAQKKKKESNMTQLQHIIRQDAHLERLQYHKMQQQQYLQELKQKNMLAKPTQQLNSKCPMQEAYLKHNTQQPIPTITTSPEIFFKGPQFQQPYSKYAPAQAPYIKSPQFLQARSNGPQIWETPSKRPFDQQPQSQPTESQPTESQTTESQPTESLPTESQPTESQPTESQPTESQPIESQPTESQPTESQPTESQPTESQEQHPLDRRIRIRDEQRSALPQQRYQYNPTDNSNQNLRFKRVPQTINLTEQPQFQLYPGDPRIKTYHAQMAQVMPRALRLMSTDEANYRTSNSTYPYQNSYYTNQQQYW